jgi:hypothetical protein
MEMELEIIFNDLEINEMILVYMNKKMKIIKMILIMEFIIKKMMIMEFIKFMDNEQINEHLM